MVGSCKGRVLVAAAALAAAVSMTNCAQNTFKGANGVRRASGSGTGTGSGNSTGSNADANPVPGTTDSGTGTGTTIGGNTDSGITTDVEVSPGAADSNGGDSNGGMDATGDTNNGGIDAGGDTDQGGLGSGGDSANKPPEGLIGTGDGTITAMPDLNACAALPTVGKQNYDGMPLCPTGSVVVVVNDGKKAELTCCPMQGANILSVIAAEVNQTRQGSCLADEVVTGMFNPSGPALACTKLNPALKLGAPTTMIYAFGANLSPAMNIIAASYNLGDTCICPEGTVYIGQHSMAENFCIDQCARIEKR